VVATILRRHVLLTAKATLFENRLLAAVLRAVGVVPLRRVRDEREAPGQVSVSRNVDAFRMVTEVLRRGGAVLVFPEGVSHDEPNLAPLKTGAARMALAASA
jgi:1-acyl-sn-glycerol-3-phosphate acyltransferase